MSSRFPRRKPRSAQVMDHVDFDEGVRPFVEVLGRLRAGNFDEELKTQLTEVDMAEDVHKRVAIKRLLNDDDDRTDVGVAVIIDTKDRWEVVWFLGPESEGIVFTSYGGILDITASMQAWRPADNALQWVESNLYCQFALELDGTVLTESVCGDQDVLSEGLSMETGREGLVFPVSLHMIMPITPGFHEVRVVAKALEGPQRFETNPDNLNNASDPYPWGRLQVGSRELIVEEDN